jgi:hypothetical protein
MNSETALITGPSSGIGLRFRRFLVATLAPPNRRYHPHLGGIGIGDFRGDLL